MGQVLQADATAVISVTSPTVITMAANVAQTIGGGQFVTSAVTCTTSVSGAGGIDTGSVAINTLYYLYLVRASGIISLVASTNATAPVGFAAFKRVGQASTNASSQWIAAGNSVTSETGRIGQVLSAMLTELQFQAIHGNTWILADGRSVAGSSYALTTGASTAPDLRGVALRGKNNGRADGNQNPDGDLALGAFQGHQFGQHTHTQNQHQHVQGGGVDNGVASRYGTGSPGSQSIVSDFNSFQGTYQQSFLVSPTTATNQDSGGNETRMRNVTVNHFLKIN